MGRNDLYWELSLTRLNYFEMFNVFKLIDRRLKLF